MTEWTNQWFFDALSYLRAGYPSHYWDEERWLATVNVWSRKLAPYSKRAINSAITNILSNANAKDFPTLAGFESVVKAEQQSANARARELPPEKQLPPAPWATGTLHPESPCAQLAVMWGRNATGRELSRAENAKRAKVLYQTLEMHEKWAEQNPDKVSRGGAE